MTETWSGFKQPLNRYMTERTLWVKMTKLANRATAYEHTEMIPFTSANIVSVTATEANTSINNINKR